MEIIWRLDESDITRLQEFVTAHAGNDYVRARIQRNVLAPPAAVDIDTLWREVVYCLLTSQQRSGPGSPVRRFMRLQPFPVAYEVIGAMDDPEAACRRILQEFGGIRFTNRIPQWMAQNHMALESGLWPRTEAILQEVIGEATPAAERKAAEFIQQHYAGLGPKQACNLLQGLGVSKYEIPIDSRISRWLNHFGFPVRIAAAPLADSDYYNLISDGIQAMCRQSNTIPCVLDAAIFSSYDGDGWTDENVP
jgi:thermostable 8-oxoguanine DNA glycosylase